MCFPDWYVSINRPGISDDMIHFSGLQPTQPLTFAKDHWASAGPKHARRHRHPWKGRPPLLPSPPSHAHDTYWHMSLSIKVNQLNHVFFVSIFGRGTKTVSWRTSAQPSAISVKAAAELFKARVSGKPSSDRNMLRRQKQNTTMQTTKSFFKQLVIFWTTTS